MVDLSCRNAVKKCNTPQKHLNSPLRDPSPPELGGTPRVQTLANALEKRRMGLKGWDLPKIRGVYIPIAFRKRLNHACCYSGRRSPDNIIIECSQEKLSSFAVPRASCPVGDLTGAHGLTFLSISYDSSSRPAIGYFRS
ncbi:hypothetical protein PM082_002045 [Marasmius tenuissimus]|nr:hypothetical protein PM082_002045 [Marasmius tenuissimus]